MSNFLISCRNDSTPEGKPPTGQPGTKLSNVTTYIQMADGDADYDLRTTMLPADWMKAIAGTTPQNKTVLVFVHGFADKSDAVVQRHNSIKKNLPPDVALISFDWPAGNDFEPYKTDKGNALASAPRLLFDCLITLINGGFSGGKIHLFAHSMGAYVTENAFQIERDIKINHVLMAAADVDQSNYVKGSAFLANFLSKCQDLTAYWSTDDAALQYSEQHVPINDYTPLGLKGYPDPDAPDRCYGVQCTTYYNRYVKYQGQPDTYSHIWYIVYPPNPGPVNDFYTDLNKVLPGPSSPVPPPGPWPARGTGFVLRRPPT